MANDKRYLLILGGTKGLGLALAHEAVRRGFVPVVTGRSIDRADIRRALPKNAIRVYQDLMRPSTALNIPDPYPRSCDHVFWNAGAFLRKDFRSVKEEDIEKIMETVAVGGMKFLRYFHSRRTTPYHLVVTASTSSWRLREDEEVYCAAKAAQAHFARNFAGRLFEDLSGSRLLLVHLGGMKTENFWEGTDQDISEFMEESDVARIMFEAMALQENPVALTPLLDTCLAADEKKPDTPKRFLEIQIMRGEKGKPVVSFGPRMPEVPE